MSDNGVVVLVTKDVIGQEYRVAYVKEVDALYGVFDDKTGRWNGDSDIILDNFAECDVFTDEDVALSFAAEIADQSEYLENGIRVISDFKDIEFTSL